MRRRWLAVVILAIGWAGCAEPSSLRAQSDDPTEDRITFITGSQLDRHNALAMSVWWSDGELRNRLQAFARQQGVGVFLDRRVNPQRPVNLGVNDRTSEQVLWRLAETNQIAVCRVEDLYYFGPPEAAIGLPLVIRALRQFAVKQRKRHQVNWLQTIELNTEPVVEVRPLLERLGEQHGFRIEGLDSIPHDTWQQVELPRTTLLTTVQILLTGFSKSVTFDPTGETLTLIEFPKIERGSLELEIPAGFTAGEAGKLVQSLRSEHPQVTARVRGKCILAEGRATGLHRFRAALVAAQQPRGIDGEKSFSLAKTTALRGTLLASIAGQTNTELVFPPAFRDRLEERITVELSEVSLAELLFEVLKGTGLKAEIAGGQLRLSPQE